MQRIVWRNGLIAGGILAAMIALMVPLSKGGTDFERSELIGYSTMVLAFLLVFFGIRSYRETERGGAIGFGEAVKVGLLITLIASIAYVVAWEIVYYGFLPDFVEQYQAHYLAKLQASGASGEELAAAEQQMVRFAEWYANPLFNVAMTLLEVFPIGLLVTLISAAILRRRRVSDAEAGAAMASS